jgi:hypothetical protein
MLDQASSDEAPKTLEALGQRSYQNQNYSLKIYLEVYCTPVVTVGL